MNENLRIAKEDLGAAVALLEEYGDIFVRQTYTSAVQCIENTLVFLASRKGLYTDGDSLSQMVSNLERNSDYNFDPWLKNNSTILVQEVERLRHCYTVQMNVEHCRIVVAQAERLLTYGVMLDDKDRISKRTDAFKH